MVIKTLVFMDGIAATKGLLISILELGCFLCSVEIKKDLQVLGLCLRQPSSLCGNLFL